MAGRVEALNREAIGLILMNVAIFTLFTLASLQFKSSLCTLAQRRSDGQSQDQLEGHEHGDQPTFINTRLPT
jgi:hypothetical protein